MQKPTNVDADPDWMEPISLGPQGPAAETGAPNDSPVGRSGSASSDPDWTTPEVPIPEGTTNASLIAALLVTGGAHVQLAHDVLRAAQLVRVGELRAFSTALNAVMQGVADGTVLGAPAAPTQLQELSRVHTGQQLRNALKGIQDTQVRYLMPGDVAPLFLREWDRSGGATVEMTRGEEGNPYAIGFKVQMEDGAQLLLTDRQKPTSEQLLQMLTFVNTRSRVQYRCPTLAAERMARFVQSVNPYQVRVNAATQTQSLVEMASVIQDNMAKIAPSQYCTTSNGRRVLRPEITHLIAQLKKNCFSTYLLPNTGCSALLMMALAIDSKTRTSSEPFNRLTNIQKVAEEQGLANAVLTPLAIHAKEAEGLHADIYPTEGNPNCLKPTQLKSFSPDKIVTFLTQKRYERVGVRDKLATPMTASGVIPDIESNAVLKAAQVLYRTLATNVTVEKSPKDLAGSDCVVIGAAHGAFSLYHRLGVNIYTEIPVTVGAVTSEGCDPHSERGVRECLAKYVVYEAAVKGTGQNINTQMVGSKSSWHVNLPHLNLLADVAVADATALHPTVDVWAIQFYVPPIPIGAGMPKVMERFYANFGVEFFRPGHLHSDEMYLLLTRKGRKRAGPVADLHWKVNMLIAGADIYYANCVIDYLLARGETRLRPGCFLGTQATAGSLRQMAHFVGKLNRGYDCLRHFMKRFPFMHSATQAYLDVDDAAVEEIQPLTLPGTGGIATASELSVGLVDGQLTFLDTTAVPPSLLSNVLTPASTSTKPAASTSAAAAAAASAHAPDP